MDIRETEGFIPPADHFDTDLSTEDRPTFEDIRQNTEVGFVKRALGRYFMTKNPDRSIRFYSSIGVPAFRKLIMNTYGKRIYRNDRRSNYRLDATKSKIDAAMDFAVSGSVFNEAIHTVGGGMALVPLGLSVDDILHSSMNNLTSGELITDSISAVLNFSLVALQRYNRARMIKRVEEELSEGKTFSPGYENWLGMDSVAVDNYKDSLLEDESEQEPLSVIAIQSAIN